MDVRIRLASIDDSPTLVAFQLALAWETENHLVLDESTVTRGVAALFADSSKGRYWIAEEDGLPLGCTLTTPEWSEWRCATVLWIQSVYVAPESRGRGVYRAIYAHLQELVRSSPELCGIRLYAAKDNVEAQKVYRRLGMNPDHYTLFEWMKDS
jgi:ribosomal protein S18 acetylase RimI-like enzyme